ncbi:protein of unassigned function [Methylobacterium oryzae CBMB20]|uniref:Protein of unassigned function n=1 Tax=Methylobacterium oryzae CBMB20 TaxID=693986 RepID=A0A089NQ81_9HYPH|nr:protein of unassigned function [Methylobacterium oryzae CBMB20]
MAKRSSHRGSATDRIGCAIVYIRGPLMPAGNGRRIHVASCRPAPSGL